MYWIPICGMCFVAFLAYLEHREKMLKNKERMAMIEKGMTPPPDEPKNSFKLRNRPINSSAGYKAGLMLIGAALGVLVGYLLKTRAGISEFVAYSTPILTFCGILLVYFHKSKVE